MRIVLICHDNNNSSEKGLGKLLATFTHFDDPNLNYEGMSRWLSSFSELVGIVVLRQKSERIWRAVKHEIRRIGYIRFIDVLLFRVFYWLVESKKDRIWEREEMDKLRMKFPEIPENIPRLYSGSPNTKEVEGFLKKFKPDIIIFRCKELVSEKIFSIPPKGSFVMHYGICPEYRNGNGCFWALAKEDFNKFGMTLLKADKGIDTGNVYGYFSYVYNEIEETPVIMGHKVVFENLHLLKNKLLDIFYGKATAIDTKGRASKVWGQPWLSEYIRWKCKARIRNWRKIWRTIK